jgi:hypothetical protein
MKIPPNAHTLKLIHDALTSLTVTRAHVNLGERRLRRRTRERDDMRILEELAAADKSIMRAAIQLREIEGRLMDNE